MKINKLMLKLEQNKKLISELEKENKEISEKLISTLSEKNLKKYSLEQEESTLNLTVVTRSDLSFDLDMLKSKLNKKVFNDITVKNIKVDEAELRSILDSNPELKNMIKPALLMSRTLDESKMKKFITQGIINKEELEGTYKVKSSQYIKLERRFEEEEDELE